MADLSLDLLGIKFKNPLFLPSGIITEIFDHKKAEEAGAGMVVLKSITLEKRKGHPFPWVIKYQGGFLNSVGLKNPGLKKAKEEIGEFLRQSKIPVFVSVFATKVAEFKRLVEELVELKPAGIELNLSCPNVEDEFGVCLASQKDAVYQVVQAVKKVTNNIPLVTKLSPNVSNIAEIAKAAEEAGAEAISAINTVGPGMVIDIYKKRPILGNKKGGISGPAIKPIAIRCIYEIYQSVKIPILGIGGISTWQDAVEMMMAGASLVGVGSAVYLKGYGIYQKIIEGMREFIRKEKIKNIKELIGAAHEN